MRALILLNGESYRGAIDASGAVVYCCDGAYDWAKGRVKIDVNLGDFDSLSYAPDPPPAEVYPREKDYTDGELALRRALDAGATEIVIYGGGGKREDHFVGNLHLLYQAARRGARTVMVTNHARIYAATGEFVLRGAKGKTVSVTPFGGEVHILESSGFYYPLPARFVYGATIGISNVVTADVARFTVQGTVLVFVNEEAT